MGSCVGIANRNGTCYFSDKSAPGAKKSRSVSKSPREGANKVFKSRNTYFAIWARPAASASASTRLQLPSVPDKRRGMGA